MKHTSRKKILLGRIDKGNREVSREGIFYRRDGGGEQTDTALGAEYAKKEYQKRRERDIFSGWQNG